MYTNISIYTNQIGYSVYIIIKPPFEDGESVRYYTYIVEIAIDTSINCAVLINWLCIEIKNIDILSFLDLLIDK